MSEEKILVEGSAPKPTVGRIVNFRVGEYYKRVAPFNGQPSLGNMIYGNSCEADTVLPAVIIRVWGESCVNLKVLCDHPEDAWVSSAMRGDGDGQWNWPQRS